MMQLSPAWKLIHSGAQQRNGASCWKAVKQQLQHFCAGGQKPARLPQFSLCFCVSDCVCLTDGVSWPEVERLLHQSVFESMPLTGLDPEGVLVNVARPLGTLEPPTVIPWDDPLTFAKQQLRDLQAKGLSPCWQSHDLLTLTGPHYKDCFLF